VVKNDAGIDKALSDVGRMGGKIATKRQRYLRNMNRYQGLRVIRNNLDMLYDDSLVWSFTNYEKDVNLYTTYNVCRSIPDTITSKMSQSKVRPFFNSVDGTFQTRKLCLNAQRYFDLYFEKQKVYTQAAICARDAMVFDYGSMYLCDETFSIRRVRPWNVGFDPAEYTHDAVSRCYYGESYYPRSAVKRLLGEDYNEAEVSDLNKLIIYYNFDDGMKYIFVNEQCLKKRKIDYQVAPFELLYWNDPIRGYFSTSLVDDIYNIQVRIDSIIRTIDDAMSKSLKNINFVPEISDIKTSKVTNEAGLMVKYTPAPGISGVPIQTVTPQPIDAMYMQWLEQLKKDSYEIAGVSMLSAQSKKPSGITAGVALDTLQDVESERFNVFQSKYIQFYTNIAKRQIEIFPDNAKILDDEKEKWGEFKKGSARYRVQFSSANALSKDPSKKLEQIQALVQAGYIDSRTATTLLDMPDLERAYNIINSSYDYCEKVIERAIVDNNYEFSPVVDLELLKKMAAMYIMRMEVQDAPIGEVANLTKLYKITVQIKTTAMQAPMPGAMPPEGMPVEGQPPTGAENIPPVAGGIQQ
jgi:hypothetical protein